MIDRQVYELTVAPEDKERLKMVSEVVNENVCLCDLDVTSFRIRLSKNLVCVFMNRTIF